MEFQHLEQTLHFQIFLLHLRRSLLLKLHPKEELLVALCRNRLVTPQERRLPARRQLQLKENRHRLGLISLPQGRELLTQALHQSLLNSLFLIDRHHVSLLPIFPLLKTHLVPFLQGESSDLHRISNNVG